jgi:hypothetical protein
MSEAFREHAAGILRSGLSGFLALLTGGSGMFAPQQREAARGATRVLLSPGPIPTTDYYFPPPARAAWRFVDTLSEAPDARALPAGAEVVVVRHVPRGWMRLLVRRAPELGGVVLFLDDDTPAALGCAELPLGYALRSAWRFHSARARLGRIGASLWVSTPELAARYPAARLLPPAFLEPDVDTPGPRLRYFYHATGAHRREIEWLAPVVREVQARVPGARFDLVADARARRHYAGIPGVEPRAQSPWPAYRALPRRERFGLGLAPCLEGRFNAARSHVKLFEITRFGAAGIYSARAPYAGVVEHGRTGWLCGDDAGEWVEAIVAALTVEGRSAAVHAAALAHCRALRDAGAASP